MPITLALLADHKKLLPEFLEEQGLYDLPKNMGVGIRYFDRDRRQLLVKRRTAYQAKDGSYWPTGQPLIPYGLWRLHEAKKAGILFLVEGESDCWTLWNYRLPALGLPGSGTVRCLTRAMLEGVDTLYLHHEPDEGGKQFVHRLIDLLWQMKFTGKIWELRMPEGFKDPSAVHMASPDRFLDRMEEALKTAQKLELLPWGEELARLVDAPIAPTAKKAPAPSTKKDDPGSLVVEPNFVNMSAVTPKAVRWLWPERVPLGKLTILDGDPGLGKSTVALDLAARLSTGQAMPLVKTGPTLPASFVVLLSAEDGKEDTIQPRLLAAGADVRKVVLLEGIQQGEQERPVYLPLDIKHLRDVVEMTGAKLVVIDPLMAFLDDHVNTHNDQNSRRALLPLAKMADQTGIAVLIIRHLNKQGGKNALYRGGGSIGIIGAARSGMLAARDPDDPHRCLLAISKSNLARRARTLQYRLLEEGTASRVDWTGETEHHADSLLQTEGDDPAPALDEACQFLKHVLANGPVPAAEVIKEAQQVGLTEKTLRRARRALNLLVQSQTGPDKRIAGWLWSLPVEMPPQ